jgi:hypothetical protein
LRMFSPTDCVRDRLAAFFLWGDLQGLEQAIIFCLARRVNMREVGRWSRAEGMEQRFLQFRRELARRRRIEKR